MPSTELHYLFDPLCGWCYGAAPLVAEARKIVRVVPHAIGMMTGARRRAVTPQLRAFVAPHDARIAQTSGQPFGVGYLDGLLHDTGAVFDSAPPTAAILAADALAGCGLDMLARLQVAHYLDGRRIAEREVLIEVATGLGLAPHSFDAELARQSGAPLLTHVEASRALMAQSGSHGVPGFILDVAGVREVVDVSAHLGHAHVFGAWLSSRITERSASDGDRRGA
ncbi:MAG: DsbA family protein [Rhodocyclaceae bacterium]|nr:DsbA family protein [Rhodocyclaceae bacterium]